MALSPTKIVICGNYGATNLGDEAILAGLLVLTQSTFPGARAAVMSSSPAQTAKAHGVSTTLHFPAGARSFFRYFLSPAGWRSLMTVARVDLILLGGGGLFADENPRAVWIWFVQFLWFWLMRKPVFCVAQSVGPLRRRWARVLTGWVFRRAAAVTVRDTQSADLLKELGVKNVQVLADAAYAIGYETRSEVPEKTLKPVKKRVVLSLRSWADVRDEKMQSIIAEMVIWLRVEKDLETVFVPFQTCQTDDRKIYEKIRQYLGKHAAGFSMLEAANFTEALQIIRDSKYVIGMRLHSVIFAVLTGRPFLGLSYSKKVRDFIATIGLEKFALDYKSLTLEELKKSFNCLEKEQDQVVHALHKAKLKYSYEFFRHEDVLRSRFSE